MSGAGIEPASHRAGRASGRHAWSRNSGEWRQRERSGDWTGPKHASGEWPTLHLDADRDSAGWTEPELFSSPAQQPAEPRWTARDWAAADSSPRPEVATRRIDWLDGPDDDATRLDWAGAPDWAGLADVPDPKGDPKPAPAWDGAETSWDQKALDHDADDHKAWGNAAWDDKGWDDKGWDDKAWDQKAGDHDAQDRKAWDLTADDSAVRDAAGDHRIRSEADHDGWSDEEWARLGDAPTEELFSRRSVPRSHRRPEPLRKATLRVLAAVLVAGGSVGLAMNLTGNDGGNQAAQTQVEDQNVQRVDGPVLPTPSASATPTDPQTTAQADSAATQPLAPATTRKPTTVTTTTAPPVVAPVATTSPATTPPAPTTPPATTPPPTTDPTPAPPSDPPTSNPPTSTAPASSQPTP